jgi:hypothetical protein
MAAPAVTAVLMATVATVAPAVTARRRQVPTEPLVVPVAMVGLAV